MNKLLISLICTLALNCTAAFAQVEGDRAYTSTKVTDYSFVSVKTNLLYDLLLVPNLGLEVNIYDNWTIYGDLMYAGWDMPKAHFYWDLYGAQFGARKYFGAHAAERSFTGHHVGIYGQALAYDLQAGNIGQQTYTINMGAGVEYGYSFPVALGFNIDVEIGLGYLNGKYFEYIVEEDHYTWRGTVHRSWFGPTKASVSLVWLIKTKKKPKNKR